LQASGARTRMRARRFDFELQHWLHVVSSKYSG
jgi:hypothetical protein